MHVGGTHRPGFAAGRGGAPSLEHELGLRCMSIGPELPVAQQETDQDGWGGPVHRPRSFQRDTQMPPEALHHVGTPREHMQPKIGDRRPPLEIVAKGIGAARGTMPSLETGLGPHPPLPVGSVQPVDRGAQERHRVLEVVADNITR